MKPLKFVSGIFLFLLPVSFLCEGQPYIGKSVCLKLLRVENRYLDSIAGYLSSEWLDVGKESKEDMLMALWIKRNDDTSYHVVGSVLGYGRDDCDYLYGTLKSNRCNASGYFLYDSTLVLVYPKNDLQGLFTPEAATLTFYFGKLYRDSPLKIEEKSNSPSEWEPFEYYFTLKPDGFSLDAVVGYRIIRSGGGI